MNHAQHVLMIWGGGLVVTLLLAGIILIVIGIVDR